MRHILGEKSILLNLLIPETGSRHNEDNVTKYLRTLILSPVSTYDEPPKRERQATGFENGLKTADPLV